MKYVSIDIETTGINRDFCDLIEFAAIIEDTENQLPYEEVPKFHCYLKPPRPEGYRGELYAINMHVDSGVWAEMNRLEQLQRRIDRKDEELTDQDYKDAIKFISPRKLLNQFSTFLVDNGYENKEHNSNRPPIVDLGKVVVAGKNFFAFDWNYLEPLFGERICRRSIDPAIWYMNPAIDKAPPGTSECLKRAGLTATGEHTALGDAWDVICLTRKAINSGALVKPDESA